MTKGLNINYKLLIVLLAAVSLNACNKPKEEPVFSFAVAGHVYGNPDNHTYSVYPPFLNKLKTFKQENDLQLLILTGDVVAQATEENWNTVQAEIDSLEIEWHIAPGNHDISLYMDQHIQPYKYIALERHNNLFLVLNTTFPGWTPDSLQQVFIKESLDSIDSIHNIFVFSHQLWWEKDMPDHMDLDSLRPNSYALYDGPSSFWDDAFPYFDSLEQDVYFFAGDMGCFYGYPSWYEDQYENFYFYGSGMGGGDQDNFAYVSIYADGSVQVQRIDF